MPKVQSQVFVRPPWERMMRFHNLVRNGEHPNCSTIANEFEVSVRTIMRDVDFMKYRLDLPLEFDGQQIRIDYHGKVTGDEMKLIRQVGDFATEDVVAKRVKPAPALPAAPKP